MTYEEAGYIIGNIPVPTDNKSYSIEDYQIAKTLAVAALWDKSGSVEPEEDDEKKVHNMTAEEAIEIIQTIKKVGYFMDYFADYGYVALDKAISALDKQVQKKPIKHGYIVTGDCPCCGDLQTANHKCCSNCGQAIEWDEVANK